MRDRLPFWLVEPWPSGKLRRTAAVMAGATAGVEPPAGPPSGTKLAELVEQVREAREEARTNHQELLRRLESALRERGISFREVEDAAEAAAYVRRHRPRGELATNKSATARAVAAELRGPDYPWIDSYASDAQLVASGARNTRNSDDLVPEELLDGIKAYQVGPGSGSEAIRVVARAAPAEQAIDGPIAILGASAVASDGSVYFVQHLQNVSKLLVLASDVFVVAALNKVTASRQQAEAVCRAMLACGAAVVSAELQEPSGSQEPAVFQATEGLANGPRVHVIMLREDYPGLAQGPYQSLWSCISCRACRSHCPTYPYYDGSNSGSPRTYLTAFLQGRGPSLDDCTLCGNCALDCPMGIDLPTLIRKARSESPSRRGWLQRLALSSIGSLGRMTEPVAPLVNALARSWAGRFGATLAGVTRERPLPRLQRDRLGERAVQAARDMPDTALRVVYYPGCYARYLDPSVGEASISVLGHNGFRVEVVGGACCGLPYLANGLAEHARHSVEANLKQLAPLAQEGLPIVTACPSCALAIRRLWPELVRDVRAKAVAEATQDLTAFLGDLLRRGGLATDLGPVDATVMYHRPCHVRALREGEGGSPVLGEEHNALLLLRSIPGVRASGHNAGCCGMCGSHGMKAQYYGRSMEIGGNVFAEFERAGAGLGSTECGACKMQIEHGTGLRVLHPIELLGQSYRRGKGWEAS